MGKASRKKHLASPKASQSRTPMSAALIDLVAPVCERDLPLEIYQSLISLAALAWNIALFPKAQRKEQLLAFLKAGDGIQLSFDELIAANSDEDVTDDPREGMNIIQLLKAMIHRKERLFPNDTRFVVNYEVSWKNDQPHVTVTSSDSKPNPA